jgi:hypothetical protein
MHPSVSNQLAGLSRVLADVVAPELDNPYPIDLLNGVIAALETLSRSWAEVPRFLRWDAEATTAILRRVGVSPPQPPADPLDLVALEAHHAGVRSMLEVAIPAVLADPATNAATVQLFRERIDRFPFNQPAPRRQNSC